MDFTIPPWAVYIGAWAGSVAGVRKLFDYAASAISPETQQSMSKWLKGMPAPTHAPWTTDFYDVFTRVFGKRHWSWRCLGMSVLVSTVFLFLLVLLWGSLGWIPGVFSPSNDQFRVNLVALGFGGAILNIVPDYLSLWKTRTVLIRMRHAQKHLTVAILLVVDPILTCFIFFAGFYPFIVYEVYTDAELFEPSRSPFITALTVMYKIFSISDPTSYSIYPYFDTTFFTSVWVWLYIASGLAVRTLLAYGSSVNFLRRTLDVEKQPLQSLGLVAAGIVTVVFLAIPISRLIF